MKGLVHRSVYVEKIEREKNIVLMLRDRKTPGFLSIKWYYLFGYAKYNQKIATKNILDLHLKEKPRHTFKVALEHLISCVIKCKLKCNIIN